jgi:heterodisulfide reductase subunit C
MNNFGFSINKDKSINMDEVSKELSNYLSAEEPTFDSCMSCGTCSATCSAGSFTNFSLRRINLLVLRGQLNEVKNEIDKCMLCGKCTLLCPRNVNTRGVIVAIKQYFDKNPLN